MPLPTSDFHTTICLEMRSIKYGINDLMQAPQSATGSTVPCGSGSGGPNTISFFTHMDTPIRQVPSTGDTKNANSNNNINHNINCNSNFNNNISNNYINDSNNNNGHNDMNSNNNNADLASVDSSDTYASCQTHPFLSQGDLTSDIVDPTYALDMLDMNNFYMNSIDKSLAVSPSNGKRSQVKKSTSGDTALRNLGASPLDDLEFQSFDTTERGSRNSLNEAPVPKHRKARFQQQQQLSLGSKIRTRFEATSKTSQESIETGGSGSGSTIGSKKSRKSSFIPSRSLASATKLINQHLFGSQSKGMLFNSVSLHI
jgi:hypothetical protein